MKLKLRLVTAALLTATALPAFALQLGQIQVKSALNQPLVAAIPLHPKTPAELDGLKVQLAPTVDFQRAGLPLTPTDQTLRFSVVTDNNGQKLVLVTSSQPVTDPYLDFLVEVNTREGKQIREFVVLLNPVVAAPAPTVQAAPVANAPVNGAPVPAPELPAPTQFPQPTVKPQPASPPTAAAPTPAPHAAAPAPAAPPAPKPASAQPAATPPPAQSVASNAQGSGPITVQRGDTLYHLAQTATQGTGVSINQMMLAMQAANPDAFFKHNINDLKAGAILRIPTRDQVDQRSVAAAAAEVHRQIVAWQAAKPHPATVVEGAAAEAAANAAPPAGAAPPTSDHLTLAPPTSGAGGTNNRAGVAGGTGHTTVAGLKQQLQADKDTLVSLNQSNADLASRVQSLKDIAAKSGQLLSLKDATVAELQRKLAALPAVKAHAAPQPTATTAWYLRPVVWVIAALVVLALLLLALFGRRKQIAPEAPAHGPLADPADVVPVAGDDGEPSRDGESLAHVDTEAASAPPAAVDPSAHDDPYGLTALRSPAADDVTVVTPPAAPAAPVPAPHVAADAGVTAAPLFADDPVDTKLDLARAYLDMGDAVGARAMLEEVVAEGSQAQKDEAKRLLADVAG
ncbi:MAG TPA: FimV/HubP family polar landmark protein [Rhodanobacteraceae bacterium]